MAQVRLELKEWNAEKLLARSTQILEDFAPIIADEARRQISLVQWDWDRGTLRFQSIGGLGRKVGSGVFVDAGLRDIVDRGGLRNSQQAPQITGNTLSIEWNAPYSGLILNGGNFGNYVNPAGKQVEVGRRPGRNWIAAALKVQPPREFFVTRWRQLSK